MTDEFTGNSNLKSRLKILAIVVVSFLSFWFIVHVCYTVYFGLSDTLHTADVIVVLGSKVNQDGTLSPRLESRLKRVVEIIPIVQPKFVIVSGGVGQEGFSEALKMQEYLVMNAVAKDKILVDEAGDNTLSTTKNSIRFMKEYDLKSVVIVSQFFHLLRTQETFLQCGVQSVYHVHARIFELRDAYSLIREFFGFYKYYFVGCK